MVCVQSVIKGSKADSAGVLAGDYLISINGHDIADVLDYRYFLSETKITLRLHREAELLNLAIEKEEYEDIGLEFSTFLMDEKKRCHNRCIFCFIDQLPNGMRDSLYFKDDDSRLSFLLGNYVTLTNLDEKDIDRIVEMKTSPLHISVHTTNPDLRVAMMKNPKAGQIMTHLRRFADANITLECQIVLCRDYNDKEELTRTMQDLASLSPQIESVSVVPCGLTDYRKDLTEIRPFDKKSAKEAVRQVEAFAKVCQKKYGKRIFFCGDELYLRAGLKLPKDAYYEGYPQIENGVGMMTSMQTELKDALRKDIPSRAALQKTCSIATGKAAYDYICRLVKAVEKRVKGLKCHVYCIENRFFGAEITVAGLVCGKDLKEQLKSRELGEVLYLPEVMLRHEKDLFLDSVSLASLQTDLQVPIHLVKNDGADFLQALLEEGPFQ